MKDRLSGLVLQIVFSLNCSLQSPPHRMYVFYSISQGMTLSICISMTIRSTWEPLDLWEMWSPPMQLVTVETGCVCVWGRGWSKRAISISPHSLHQSLHCLHLHSRWQPSNAHANSSQHLHSKPDSVLSKVSTFVLQMSGPRAHNVKSVLLSCSWLK